MEPAWNVTRMRRMGGRGRPRVMPDFPLKSVQLGILLNAEDRRPLGGEQLSHRVLELAGVIDPDALGTAQLGIGHPVGVVQRGVPDRELLGQLLLADLAQGVVVEQNMLIGTPYFTAVVSSVAYWPNPPSPVTATIGLPGAAAPVNGS